MADHTTHEMVPESAPLGARKWMKENLFSSPFNSVLTVLAALVVAWFFRSMLAFVFDDSRRWNSVATNMRLYFTQAYPVSQYARVWASLGTVLVLIAGSLAVWRVGGRISPRKLAASLRSAGGFLAIITLLAPGSYTGKIFWLLGFGALAIGAHLAPRYFGTHSKEEIVPTLGLVFGALGLLIAGLWVVPFGHYSTIVDGAGATQAVYKEGLIAASTRIPLTILFLVFVATYWMAKGLVGRSRDPEAGNPVMRRLLLLGWVLVLPFVVLVVMRDPRFDYGYLASVDLVILLTFVLGGGALIWLLSLSRLGEPGRALAGLTVVLAIGMWAIPMLIRIRLLGFLLAMFCVGARTFAGDSQARRRYLMLWAGVAVVLIYFLAAINTPSTLVTQSKSFLGGLSITFVLALTSITLSFPIGVLMALGRTSTMPIFRVVSTTYIELVRGIPFITVLIFFDIILVLFLPTGLEFDSVTLAILAGTLFSAAYLAENVRGGLQSISNGQYEAAKAMGLSTLQSTVFIILPQALRAVIPALVGQTIAIFKDTSLVAIIGLFDFLYIADKVIPNQGIFRGARFENLIFIAAVYWIFTFSFSRASLRLERKVGLGER